VDNVLERFDQTDPELQRRIVARFVCDRQELAHERERLKAVNAGLLAVCQQIEGVLRLVPCKDGGDDADEGEAGSMVAGKWRAESGVDGWAVALRTVIAEARDGEGESAPIDVVLHCPACLEQHIDAPEPDICECGHPARTHVAGRCDGTYRGTTHGPGLCECKAFKVAWDNPPHRSHKCHSCGAIFRPADVPTNGVAAARTRGKADTWPPRESRR
jgi:hypothetical protein